MSISKDLRSLSGNLRLSGLIPTLPERIRYAEQNRLTFEEFLELIFSEEWERRRNRLLNIKLKKAGVDSNLEGYDWDTTTQYDRGLVRRLMGLDFMERRNSILLFGPTGVGKTFLAKHLSFMALKSGYSVVFTRAEKMFRHLCSSLLDGTRERALRYYLSPDLLVIDDFATRAMTREEANDFYEIILERHERRSNIVTSARAPDEWQPLFPDPILGNSALDRLAHTSYQILMEGESIRKQRRPR